MKSSRLRMQAMHHPKKGDKISVEPIRDIKHVKAIAKLLSDKPRDHFLFMLGVNNGLRAGDLLKLKVYQFKNLKVGDVVNIIESKQGKPNILVINKPVHKSMQNYFEKLNPNDDDYVFKSRKGDKAITIQAVNNYIKKWTKELNLKGNYGAHTLRKTWGYHQRMKFNVGFEIICKRYNHSSPSVTMRYLGIQGKEVESVLMHEIC